MSNCIHCKKIRDQFGVIKKCELLLDSNGYPTPIYHTVRLAFNKPNRVFPPNGQCFWCGDEEKECPYFTEV